MGVLLIAKELVGFHNDGFCMDNWDGIRKRALEP